MHQRARQLHAAMDEEGHPRAPALFEALANELHLHILLEEELLLPQYELSSEHDASRIRAEHTELRLMLRELHRALTGDGVDDLTRLLSEHTRHEEEVLFSWADACLTPRVKRSLLDEVENPRPPVEASATQSRSEK